MSLVRQSVSVSQNNLLCQCFMLFMLEDDKSVSAVCFESSFIRGELRCLRFQALHVDTKAALDINTTFVCS